MTSAFSLPTSRDVLNTPGTAYMGDVLRSALRTASEIRVCVSFLRFSALGLYLDDLKAFRARGGRFRAIVSTYLSVTQPDAVRVLASIVGTDDVRLQDGPDGFHVKFYAFRQSDGTGACWVGSSNLTKNGLYTSVEWNTRHDDPARVVACEMLFETLWARPDVRPATPSVLEAYADRYLERLAGTPSPPSTSSTMAPVPNEAQREALAELRRLRAEGQTRAAVIAATGLGKTYLAAFDARAFEQGEPDVRARGVRVLFVAHREELLWQARETFARVLPDRSPGILASGQKPGDADLVFATVQSLTRETNRAWLERAYDYVVVDEFHHAAAASYQRVMDETRPRFLLGITATPERVDGQDVLRLCDYNVAYEARLPDAIDKGWLTPFHYYGVADEVDYDRVPWRNGQFDPTELENALMLEGRTDLLLKHAHEKGFDGLRRATVAFCAGVRHAKFMAQSLERRGHGAVAVTGETSPEERRRVYDRFADPHDPLEWLFVADVLNEGVDIPAINSVAFLRPTQSPGLFLQQLGRGLRLHPDTEVLTVLDFVGHHRNALVPLQALSATAANASDARVLSQELQLTPPRHCEIILEDRTREVLLNLRRQQARGAQGKRPVKEAYERLRVELCPPDEPHAWRRPVVMDFWGREDLPAFGEVCRAFGSWLGCRVEMGDADDWEREAHEDDVTRRLLQAAEKDLQAQRVTPYALQWALAHFPDDASRGLRVFTKRFPHWAAKLEEVNVPAAFEGLARRPQFNGLLRDGTCTPEVKRRMERDPRIAQEIEARLMYHLARDFRLRHAGMLRTPSALERYRGYTRAEVVNHFGMQYDPARHNTGMIKQGAHIALLAQLDTSDARPTHQYTNGFTPDATAFSWQSQNRQTPEKGTGREIVEHAKAGVTVHLFVQGGRASGYVYLGPVTVEDVTGSEPFTAKLRLPEPLPMAARSYFEQ